MIAKLTKRVLPGVAVVVLMLGVLPALGQEATETPEADAPSLVGSVWQWVQFGSGAEAFDVTASDYTVTFTEDGSLHVRADCNVGSGSYTVEGSTLTVGNIATTRALCPPESLSQDFLQYLSQVAVFSFTEDGELLLEASADSGTLTFVAQPQVTGTVSYLLRIALTPGSVIRVQVQDVTIADAPTTILGEQVIVTDGEQVPIPFVVSYPAAAIDESRRYSLSARITDADGRLLFISDTLIPVITGGAPVSDVGLVLVPVQS